MRRKMSFGSIQCGDAIFDFRKGRLTFVVFQQIHLFVQPVPGVFAGEFIPSVVVSQQQDLPVSKLFAEQLEERDAVREIETDQHVIENHDTGTPAADDASGEEAGKEGVAP